MVSEEEYWEALQAQVCRTCQDADAKGGCQISGGRECAIKMYLKEILDVVNSVYSPSMEPYEEALRTKVCAKCASQTSDAHCGLRQDSRCALDRYFPLIVQVIEETQLKRRLHI